MAATTRYVLLLDLKDDPDLIAAYEQWHAPGAVPAAVVRSIRSAGIAEMTIHRAGNRLVMIMEALPGFDAAAKAASDTADPDVQAWERLMDAFQQPLPIADGSKWTSASPIFSLTDQP